MFELWAQNETVEELSKELNVLIGITAQVEHTKEIMNGRSFIPVQRPYIRRATAALQELWMPYTGEYQFRSESLYVQVTAIMVINNILVHLGGLVSNPEFDSSWLALKPLFWYSVYLDGYFNQRLEITVQSGNPNGPPTELPPTPARLRRTTAWTDLGDDWWK